MGLGLGLALLPAAHAQLPFHQTIDSPTNSSWFAKTAVGLGDIDGDGTPDYAVGTVGLGSSAADRIDLYSGATGALILTLDEQDNQSDFGLTLVDAGDVDGDGRSDVLVGAPNSNENDSGNGSAFIFSSATGQVVYSLIGPDKFDRLGTAAAVPGDLNGDGVRDFVISSGGETIQPHWGGIVRAYDGVDGSELYWHGNGFTTTDIAEGYGDTLAPAGDLDGDGVGDYIVGVPARRFGDLGRIGAIEGRSGASGALLFEVFDVNPTNFNAGFGKGLAAGVDLNGDGIGEILVGSPGNHAGDAEGTLNVLDGATQTWLAQHKGTDSGPGDFGYHAAFVGDMNGDGVQDYGATYDYTGTIGYSGYVRIFSGADHTLLDEFDAPNDEFGFGSCLAALGDVTGDALPDVFVGARQTRTGYVMAVAGARAFGEVPGETTQSLDLSWVPVDPQDPARGRFEVHGAPAGVNTGWFAVSYASVAGDYAGATMWVDPSSPGFAIVAIPFGGTGSYVSLDTTLRQPAIDGLNIYCQVLCPDPASPLGFVTSAALDLRTTD